MKKRYTIEDVEKILTDNGIEVSMRAKVKKGSDIERPERKIKGVAGINIPPKALHYQIRVIDALYNRIKNDDRLNIDNTVNFPLDDFRDENGKLIKKDKMPSDMKQHFASTYSEVILRKQYANNAENIDYLQDNRVVYCIDHGAVEESHINKGKINIIVLYTAEDMDIILEHIIAYMKDR